MTYRGFFVSEPISTIEVSFESSENWVEQGEDKVDPTSRDRVTDFRKSKKRRSKLFFGKIKTKQKLYTTACLRPNTDKMLNRTTWILYFPQILVFKAINCLYDHEDFQKLQSSSFRCTDAKEKHPHKKNKRMPEYRTLTWTFVYIEPRMTRSSWCAHHLLDPWNYANGSQCGAGNPHLINVCTPSILHSIFPCLITKKTVK